MRHDHGLAHDDVRELRMAREVLALTYEELAAELHVTEGEVRAWETGSPRMPRHARRRLRHVLDRADWEAELEARGQSPCEWIAALANRHGRPMERKEGRRVYLRVAEHLETCDECRSRTRLLFDRVPPGYGSALRGILSGVPGWAEAALIGAAALFVMTVLRGAVLFRLGSQDPVRLLGAALLAAGGGAIGGVAYSLTRPKLKPLGRIGDYLTGIVCMAAYVGTFIVVSRAVGDPIVKDTSGFVIFAVATIGYGLLIGHAWFYRSRLRNGRRSGGRGSVAARASSEAPHDAERPHSTRSGGAPR